MSDAPFLEPCSTNIDLSVGSVIALDGIILASILDKGMPLEVAILACMAVSLLTGVYNAIMITKIKVPVFIATLAGMQIFRGACYLITDGKSIVINNKVIKALGRGYSFGIPNAVIIMLVVVIIFTFLCI